MALSGEPFLDFDEQTLEWWEERPRWEPPPAARVVPARRRRPPPRTLASDLARLRVVLEPHGPAIAAAAILVLVVVVAASVLRGGEEPAAQQTSERPRAAPGPANQTDSPLVPQPRRLLREGQRGADVRDLQHALASLGYYGAAADGAYGEGTTAAVTSFQAAEGLLADGIVGATTAAALQEAVAARAEIDLASAEEGLGAAVAAGRLQAEAAARHRETLADAREALAALPPGRAALVAAVLRSVAVHADVYDGPRARTLFGMLDANVGELRARALPAVLEDFVAADGVVYRFYSGQGFQFNPLTNFSRLNRLARKGQRVQAAELAEALVARGIPVGNALAWEYYFPFGGPSRWTSGFAQAVGAQALARAGELLDDPGLLASARAAFRLIPRDLSLDLPSGAWIQEYGYSDMPILNAQLQSVVSLSNYVEITGDEQARALTETMAASAGALLHRFDTGCWSRYSLDGSPASAHYHAYHVDLLEQLARMRGEPIWGELARRWAAYEAAGGC